LDQVILCALRVELNLVDGRLDLSVGHNISDQLNVEVRKTDTPHETFLDEIFKLAPEHVHRDSYWA
jgi:hypothetical protein